MQELLSQHQHFDQNPPCLNLSFNSLFKAFPKCVTQFKTVTNLKKKEEKKKEESFSFFQVMLLL